MTIEIEVRREDCRNKKNAMIILEKGTDVGIRNDFGKMEI